MHKQILSPCIQVTNMDRIERLNAHNMWFKAQMCVLRVSMMIYHIWCPNPKKTIFFAELA